MPLRHRDAVHVAAFSPDGNRVVTCARDHVARLWDARTGRPLSQPLRHPEQPLVAAFTPDGATLYTGTQDGFVSRWDLRAIGADATQNFPAHRAEFSLDGSRVLAPAGSTPATWIREMQTLRPVGVREELPPDARPVRFSADAQHLALVTAAGVEIWSSGSATPAKKVAAIAMTERVNDVRFAPDGTRFATASENRTVRVWDWASGAAVTSSLAHDTAAATVRFSPDGKILVATTFSPDSVEKCGAIARLWDIASSQPLGAPLQHADYVVATAFSADGSLVATAGKDNTARVWDAHTGAPVSPVLRHLRTVEMITFSPDSRRVATASWDGTARIWDARTGAALGRPAAHDQPVLDVQFSPDGRRIATASRDKSARVWDAGTGYPLTDPLRHDAAVVQVRFHPDGEHLLASAENGFASMWLVPDFRGTAPAWLPAVAETIALAEVPTETAPLESLAGYEAPDPNTPANPDEDAYRRLGRSLFRQPARESARQSATDR
jgi:WD40 repeat protein